MNSNKVSNLSNVNKLVKTSQVHSLRYCLAVAVSLSSALFFIFKYVQNNSNNIWDTKTSKTPILALRYLCIAYPLTWFYFFLTKLK